MIDALYRRRHALRILGLVLLVAGLPLIASLDEAAGVALVATAAVVLASVQPTILAHVRSRRARRLAPRNGHGPGADASELDDYLN